MIFILLSQIKTQYIYIARQILKRTAQLDTTKGKAHTGIASKKNVRKEDTQYAFFLMVNRANSRLCIRP
jgi:hypothetical protein